MLVVKFEHSLPKDSHQSRKRAWPMPREWYYAKGAERFGPLSSAEIRQLAEEGVISQTDLVWADGMDEWKPARTVKGLFPNDAVKLAPPPLPPSSQKSTTVTKPSVPLREMKITTPGTTAAGTAAPNRHVSNDLDDFDPYHKWLGIPKGKRPPTHYQLLGISRNEIDRETIQAAAERQQAFVKSFRVGPYGNHAASIIYQIEEAVVTLLNPELRREYDAQLKRQAKRRRIIGIPVPLSLTSGSQGVGEGSEFVRQYAGIVSILVVAFLVVAVASFYLPWHRLDEQDERIADAAPGDALQAAGLPHGRAGGGSGMEAARSSSISGAGTSPRFAESIGIKLVPIGPGSFLMGSPETEAGREEDEFQHRVTLTQPFSMAAHEVTVGQFRRFVEDAAYKTDAERDGKGVPSWNQAEGKSQEHPEYNWRNTGFPQTDSHPVVDVSWNDAQEFCRWLSRKDGRRFRLPTEAEWEYACRAGTTTRFNCGDEDESLAGAANVADSTARTAPTTANYWKPFLNSSDGFAFTAPVGSYHPNAWGLFDMHGNVWERCEDWSFRDYYRSSPEIDPKGPDNGGSRQILNKVIRGGAWDRTASHCRSANRLLGGGLNGRDEHIGFRVVAASNAASAGEQANPPAEAAKDKAKTPETDPQPKNESNQRTQDESQAIAIIEMVGGKFQRDEKLPGRPITEIVLSFTPFTDVGLKELRNLENLTALKLIHTQITDAGLTHLRDLKNLATLDLSETPITDTGLKELRELKNLRDLGLRDTKITDAGLKELSTFKNVARLGIRNTRVTDAGLIYLIRLTNLQYVRIHGTQVTSAGVDTLKSAFPGLEIDRP